MNHIRTTFSVLALAMLAMMASAGPSHKHKLVRAKTAPSKVSAPIVPSEEVRPMVGTWSLRDGDKPRGDIRMVFRPNGTFAFVGPNWQSAGVFKLREHKLDLEWTVVDGSKVAPGTIKKAYPMTEDDASFTIDKYTYFKLHN